MGAPEYACVLVSIIIEPIRNRTNPWLIADHVEFKDTGRLLPAVFGCRRLAIDQVFANDIRMSGELDRNRRRYDGVNLRDVFEILRRLLKFKPEERIDVDKALRHLLWVDFQRQRGHVEETSQDFAELSLGSSDLAGLSLGSSDHDFSNEIYEDEDADIDQQHSEAPTARALTEVSEERLNRFPI